MTPQDASLRPLAAAIAAMEDKALAREFAYRKKDRFQLPLGLGLVAIALGLLLPPPRLRRPATPALFLALLGLVPAPTMAQEGSRIDELLLRPKRLTDTGIRHYREGRHPEALEAFEGALAAREDDARARFNLADALYKNGKFDEAQAIYESLGDDEMLAAPARYNLGNTLFQKQDYPGAIKGVPGHAARRSERRSDAPEPRAGPAQATGATAAATAETKRQERPAGRKGPRRPERGSGPGRRTKREAATDGQGQQESQPRPQVEGAQERERFEREAGMSKELAMQLLDALQRNEKEEQKKILAARQAKRKKTDKDW